MAVKTAKSVMRKVALLSFTALATLSLAPLGSGLAPSPISTLVASAAHADDGDHGGGEDHGGGGHERSQDHASSDHASDRSSSSDDSGGQRHDDHAGRGSDDDAADGRVDDDAPGSADRHGHAHANRGGRNNVEVAVSPEGLAGLQDGSLKAVDALGRSLVVKFETEHGSTVVKVRLADRSQASMGPISGVTLVSAL